MKNEANNVSESLVRNAQKQARQCVEAQGYPKNERDSASRYNRAYWNMFRGILWVAVNGNEKAYWEGMNVSNDLHVQSCEAADWRNY